MFKKNYTAEHTTPLRKNSGNDVLIEQKANLISVNI